MKTRIEFDCKFCGSHRVLDTFVPDDCPPLALEKWKQMLVCNRCADYERARRDTEDLVAKQAASLTAIRMCNLKEERLKELEERCRRNLVLLTKKFANLVCGRNRCTLIWEPEIVEQILDDPKECRSVLSHYIRNLSKMTGTPIAT